MLRRRPGAAACSGKDGFPAQSDGGMVVCGGVEGQAGCRSRSQKATRSVTGWLWGRARAHWGMAQTRLQNIVRAARRQWPVRSEETERGAMSRLRSQAHAQARRRAEHLQVRRLCSEWAVAPAPSDLAIPRLQSPQPPTAALTSFITPRCLSARRLPRIRPPRRRPPMMAASR